MMKKFATGQRWLSDADNSLGLGIVTAVDSHRVTLFFPAIDEERVYAGNRAPLTRLILMSGDRLTKRDGQILTVSSIEEEFGVIYYTAVSPENKTYRVCEVELDYNITLNTPLERLLNNQLGKCSDFALRSTTLMHAAAGDGFGLKGFLGPRTSLLSHQLYVASMVGKRFSPRVLLADEVGLGKTIEAGLILNQQILRQRVQRVLVLVPESLTHQWLLEMLRRFYLPFSLLDEARLKESDPSTEFSESPLVISPLTLFEANTEICEIVQSLDWDMVVIDEAHNLSDFTSPESDMGTFIRTLTQRSHGLLLLTAIPEQAGLESHFQRLQLLDPARYNDFNKFQEEQSQFGEWSSLIEKIVSGERVKAPKGIDPDASNEEMIRQMLDRFGTGRVLYRNTRKVVSGFPRRHYNCVRLQIPPLYGNNAENLYPECLHPKAEWLEQDPRVLWVKELLKDLKPDKALLICANRDTAVALEHHLHLKEGIRCAAFHESLTLIERDRAAAYFAEEIGGAQVLICSEIGSEGRNFQFVQHLICFDLPEHPDLLEQRIGRLDRIGQLADIHIHVPVLARTAQEVLFSWLDQGLGAFSMTCSVGHQLHQEFKDSLRRAMRQPNENFDPLISSTRNRRILLQAEVERGRDRLLERNSHDLSEGKRIIAVLHERESNSILHEFIEQLFDRIGLDQEYLQENIVLLKPTEALITGKLPGLNEEGIKATYDRATALARDDLTFLSWEHSIILETMQALLGSDIGKASVGTFQHPKIREGTVFLEALSRVECLAPRYLEIGQFLDQKPLRFMASTEGHDVSKKLSSDFLNQRLENLPSGTSAAVLNKLRNALESTYPMLENAALEIVSHRRETAIDKARVVLTEELSRLEYLGSINPSVRQEEIEAMTQRRSDCIGALTSAHPVIEGLRVCIAV